MSTLVARQWVWVAVLAGLWAGAFIGGCGHKPEDAVLAQYQLAEEGIASRNAEQVRNTMSTESQSHYLEILRLAKEARVEQTNKLRPSQLSMVLALRNRATSAEIRAMTLDSLILWFIDKEIFFVDKDMGIYPMGVTIKGDRAEIQMGIEVERQTRSRRLGRRGGGAVGSVLSEAFGTNKRLEPIPGYVQKLVNLNGFWYFDSVSFASEFDQVMAEAAKEEKMPLTQYMALIEKEEAGELKPTIWDVPK